MIVIDSINVPKEATKLVVIDDQLSKLIKEFQALRREVKRFEARRVASTNNMYIELRDMLNQRIDSLNLILTKNLGPVEKVKESKPREK